MKKVLSGSRFEGKKWTDKCDLCETRKPVELLTWSGYVGENGQQFGRGLVCQQCWRDLPGFLTYDGATAALLSHPY